MKGGRSSANQMLPTSVDRSASPSFGLSILYVRSEPGERMMTRFFSSKPKSQADVFVGDAYPVPVIALAILALFIGNAAVTLSAIASLG